MFSLVCGCFPIISNEFLILFVISRIFWQNYSFEAKSFGILSLIRIGRLSSEPYTFAVAGTAKKRSIYSQNFSSIQIIVAYYILMTVISYLLFCLPIFREPDSHVPFIDLFFLAISTVSVTGLTTVDINSVLMIVGLSYWRFFPSWWLRDYDDFNGLFILSKRRITLKQRQLIMTDMNQPRLSGIVRLIRTTFDFNLVPSNLRLALFALFLYKWLLYKLARCDILWILSSYFCSD